MNGLGSLAVLAVVLFIGYLLHHALVVVPRKARALLDGLVRRGYEPIGPDDRGLADACAALAPYAFDNAPEDEPRFKCRAAVVQRRPEGNRYVMIADWIRRREARRRPVVEGTVLLENRRTGVEGAVHVNAFIVDHDRSGLAHAESARRSQVTPALRVRVEGPDTFVPPALQVALSEAAPSLLGAIRANQANPENNINTRFTASGWGLWSNLISDAGEFEAFLKLGERLSQALR